MILIFNIFLFGNRIGPQLWFRCILFIFWFRQRRRFDFSRRLTSLLWYLLLSLWLFRNGTDWSRFGSRQIDNLNHFLWLWLLNNRLDLRFGVFKIISIDLIIIIVTFRLTQLSYSNFLLLLLLLKFINLHNPHYHYPRAMKNEDHIYDRWACPSTIFQANPIKICWAHYLN